MIDLPSPSLKIFLPQTLSDSARCTALSKGSAAAAIMMTAENDRNNVFSSRHGLIEYLSDTVILLRFIHPSEISVDIYLVLEVVKMRMASHI